jgi:5-methylcytosine-specific restriction endonuclease McrA
MLVRKYVKQGEKLLANHSDSALEARRERGRARVRRHKEKYPERVLASAKKTYVTHRAKRRLQAKQRYDSNAEAENARARAYYAEHVDKILPQKKAYRLEHAEEISKSQAIYRATHPEVIVLGAARRRARKLNAPINDLTAAQWLEIQAAYDHRCVYCGKRFKGHLTQEHITPLSKGGPNTAANVVPACKSCNSRKHDGPPLAPVQPLLLTLAPSKKPKTGTG